MPITCPVIPITYHLRPIEDVVDLNVHVRALGANHLCILGIEGERHGLVGMPLEDDFADNLDLWCIAKGGPIVVAHELVSFASFVLIVSQMASLAVHFLVPAQDKEALAVVDV